VLGSLIDEETKLPFWLELNNVLSKQKVQWQFFIAADGG